MHDPERYESNKSAAARDAEQYVPRMVGDMKWNKDETILDYGCGAGSTGANFIMPTVKLNNSKMYSVDISKEMVAHAMRQYSNSSVTYAVGNILDDDFPYKDMQFDKIFAVYVLHFVKDFREALRRFHKLLKPGGQLGFTVLTRSTLYLMHQKLGQDPKWSMYMKGYEEFVPEWVEQQENALKVFKTSLEDIGFEIQDLSVNKQEYVFPKFETLIELFFSLNPYIKEIPEHLHADFKQEHRDFLVKYWNIDENSTSISTNYDLLYAVVQKK